MIVDNWVVVDQLTGMVYPQPNKMIAQAVAQMHGHCDVMTDAEFIERYE